MALRLGPREFGEDELVIMAIVNRTPDSFFDRGATFADEAAFAAADRAMAEGAAILDIGGVKAGPGEEVTVEEELRRTVPFVAELRGRHPEAVISVDTWRHEVGEAVCEAGADLLNDAWGGADPKLAEVAARYDVGLVCTHAGRAEPRTRPHRVGYADVMADILEVTVGLAERAAALGVRRDALIIDPGHDFDKNTRHSLEATRRLPEMTATGFPVLVSLSNKDFVGETLDRPVDERLLGTLATTAVSAWLGARIYRAHQVAETRQVLDMVASIRGTRPPAVARRGLA
ncbi:dihydropteroate synthase [Kitasatospora sp. MAA4]|nr:dihydropteroate synthase [Kitasatospora sp. MAA4]